MRPGVSFVANPQLREDLRVYCGKWPDMTAEYDRFVAVARGRNRLLDVGARHCAYSLTFCAINPLSSALAIEPSKQNAEIAQANIRLNEFSITLAECAAAASSGVILGRLHASGDIRSIGDGGDVSLPCKPVDQICREFDFVPDMIKIDAEGYELDILRGAGETLSHKPTLMVEVHPQFLRERGQHQMDIHALLIEAGYRIDDVTETPFDALRFGAQDGLMFHAVCHPIKTAFCADRASPP